MILYDLNCWLKQDGGKLDLWVENVKVNTKLPKYPILANQGYIFYLNIQY